MKCALTILFLLMVLAAPGPGFMDDVLTLTGAADEEAVGEEALERFSALESHPLPINLCGRERLISSGLFTPYQAASLLDYRSRHGDVLSVYELAAVDGFGERCARALGRFVSFDSKLQPGALSAGKSAGEVLASVTGKKGAWKEGAKAKYSMPGKFGVAAAVRSDAGGEATYACHAAAYGKRHLGKLIVGDYNARFGQGLCLWSGFSTGGFMDPASFSRRPSGISGSWSYGSAGYRGVAADFSFGRLSVSAMTDFEDHIPAGNITWYGRKWDVGVTYADKLSADGRVSLGGIDVFGEIAADFGSSTIAGVAGMSIPVGESRIGLLYRYYPENYSGQGSGAARAWSKTSDETGIAAAFSAGNFVTSLDLARRFSSGDSQLKFVASGQWSVGQRLMLKPKLTERLRDYGLGNRTELRADLVREQGRFRTTLRADGVYGRKFSFLSYLEQGFVTDWLSVYARGTLFFVDEWDDRIYCYERDAPGRFSVPAYYGRGYSFSLYGGWKRSFRKFRLKAYLRGDMVSYPWASPGQTKRKPGTAGLHFQTVLDF